MLDAEGQHIVIITDHKWHNFKARDEVPDGVLKNQFTHLEAGEYMFDTGFLKYKEWWYHMSDFMVINRQMPLEFGGWHGYHSDSFYSGVLIEISYDCEQYRIGRYMA